MLGIREKGIFTGDEGRGIRITLYFRTIFQRVVNNAKRYAGDAIKINIRRGGIIFNTR